MASDDRALAAFARWGLDAVDNPNLLDAVCVANSFGASTLVALADGTHAPIADVQVGDEVLAYDFDTDAIVGRVVTATLPHTDWLCIGVRSQQRTATGAGRCWVVVRVGVGVLV